MKRFTKYCLLLAACFGCLGLVFCFTGLAMGADFTGVAFYYDSETGRFYTVENKQNQEISKDFEQSYNGVDTILVEIARANMTIIPGEKENVVVKAVNPGRKFYCEQTGKTLKIKEYNKENRFFGFLDLKGKNPKIVVEVPENLLFQKLDLEVGVGSLETGELQTEKLFGECGVGNLSFTGEIRERAELECGVGEIDLTIQGQEKDFNYELETGIGEIQIGDNLFSGLGMEKQLNHQAAKKMTLECGVGNISVDFTEN